MIITITVCSLALRFYKYLIVEWKYGLMDIEYTQIDIITNTVQ